LRCAVPLAKRKGRKAFEANVRAELNAGKPPKQAEAIAYSVERAAEQRKRRAK